MLLLIAAVIGLSIGQAVWYLLCVALVSLFRSQGKRTKRLVILNLLFPPIYFCTIAALVWWAWPDKYDAYETAFGVPPSPTVTVHEGNVEGLGDWVTINLRFEATPKDIQALTIGKMTLDPHYAASTGGTIQTGAGPVPLSGKDVYVGDAPLPEFSGNDAILIYDPLTGEAWYTFDGVH